PSLPPQPNPNLPNYNPVLSRFAIWVEDETMKLDLSVAGNRRGPGNSFSRNSTVSRDPSELDLGALPLKNSQPLPIHGSGADNNTLLSFLESARNLPPDPLLLNHLTGIPHSGDLAHRVKFHATNFALSNELSSLGTRRWNLNAMVTNSFLPSLIQSNLNNFLTSLNATLPKFGERFYTYPSITREHEHIYKLRLAANIRDYIDADSQPTYVNEVWTVESGSPKNLSWQGGGDEPKALGKEAVPYFNEHAWRARLVSMSIVNGAFANTRQVSFTMDHYFEFYNPSTKAWTAPQGTRLRVYNLSNFDANQYSPIQLPDFELDLSGRVFPAGTAVVITTSPAAGEPANMTTSNSTIYRIIPSPSQREFNNRFGNRQVGSETGNNRRFGIRHYGRSATNLAPDYETEMVLTTSQGVIFASPVLALAGSGSPFEMTQSISGAFGTWHLPPDQRDRRFIWGHSLRGNDAPSRSGDPRSFNEPLEAFFGTATAGNDQFRFFNNYQGETQYTQPLPGNYTPSGNPRLTLGRPDNPEFVAPANWPDYHPQLTNGAANAYAVIADGPMQSIGELGHIYDPHRKLDPSSPRGILTARGGGRTLKIGQQDDLVG
ncbi:MAG: hypothetical protein NZL93_03635, partial [Chthoniobacterales bacterium]|nr:hypothetical protein [Chthoniobacterales bacterium]